eukprot:5162514-Amphidinium_carterae.3
MVRTTLQRRVHFTGLYNFEGDSTDSGGQCYTDTKGRFHSGRGGTRQQFLHLWMWLSAGHNTSNMAQTGQSQDTKRQGVTRCTNAIDSTASIYTFTLVGMCNPPATSIMPHRLHVFRRGK